MLSFGVKSNIPKLVETFSRSVPGQVRFATSLAINRVAEFSVTALKANMNVVFDRPKPYIVNSLFIKRSSKANLTARIFHSDQASKTLQYEIVGGNRDEKPFEYKLGNFVLIPTKNVRRDQYGNVSKGMIAKILKEARPLGQKSEFVYVPRNNISVRSSKLEPGIYQRMSSGKIRALFFIRTSTLYHPRYDMLGVVQRTIQAEFSRQFAAQMDYALSTTKLKV